jgi:hypothetical protein
MLTERLLTHERPQNLRSEGARPNFLSVAAHHRPENHHDAKYARSPEDSQALRAGSFAATLPTGSHCRDLGRH